MDPNTDTGTYRIGQRVLVKTAIFGLREGMIRDFRWSDEGDDLVVIDFDPASQSGAVAGHLGHVYDIRQIVGPVVTQR